MQADLPALLPLVCPACRARTERGREMHTLALGAVWRRSPGDAAGVVEVEEGELVCDNQACRRRYPILGGVPVIVPDLARFLDGVAPALGDGLLPETLALLAAAGPDDAPLARAAEHLSIYLDAHWGDRADPPPDGPGMAPPPWYGFAPQAERLRARASAPVACAVELGAGVGRGLYEIAQGATLTIGLDLQLPALLRARRLLAGQAVAYARRVIGRVYARATLAPPPPPPGRVALVCADALDPPLVPGGFDRVVALNLVDAVHAPARLVSVVDGLCAPGGELMLASPYAWQSGIVAEDGRLGDGDPAAFVRARLRGDLPADGDALEASYAIEDEAELDWVLRRDGRAANLLRTHWLRARKHG